MIKIGLWAKMITLVVRKGYACKSKYMYMLNTNSTITHLTPNLSSFYKIKSSLVLHLLKQFSLLWYRVEVFNLFLGSVFVRFIDEKYLSHSAVLTGMMSASLDS